MKKKFILAALVAILIKACLIYLAIEYSARDLQRWKVSRTTGVNGDTTKEQLVLISPAFKIDRIYRSMQGPVAGYNFRIDTSVQEILWITGYHVKVRDEWKNKTLSDDFICHNNLDFDLAEHHGKWGTEDRIDSTYPRLMTLTQGQTSLEFPKGFGFPVFSDETMSVLTQVLNHNKPDIDIRLRHEIRLDYLPHTMTSGEMKPLFERSIFVMLPFDESNPGEMPDDPKGCVPVDPNNHRYQGDSGGVFSGHWVIGSGAHKYRYNVTKMINLPYDTRLHYAGVHTHPFTEWLELYDLTDDTVIFKAVCENFSDKTGLKNIAHFSSRQGLPVFRNHEYELIVKVNNTSGEDQDMMASMFLYFYDPEMDNIVKEKF